MLPFGHRPYKLLFNQSPMSNVSGSHKTGTKKNMCNLWAIWTGAALFPVQVDMLGMSLYKGGTSLNLKIGQNAKVD